MGPEWLHGANFVCKLCESEMSVVERRDIQRSSEGSDPSSPRRRCYRDDKRGGCLGHRNDDDDDASLHHRQSDRADHFVDTSFYTIQEAKDCSTMRVAPDTNSCLPSQ